VDNSTSAEVPEWTQEDPVFRAAKGYSHNHVVRPDGGKEKGTAHSGTTQKGGVHQGILQQDRPTMISRTRKDQRAYCIPVLSSAQNPPFAPPCPKIIQIMFFKETSLTMDRQQQIDANTRSKPAAAKLGVVVIGRNEGSRLIRCLESMPDDSVVVYVDSGSTDGSVQAAREREVDVVELDLSIPFTAARARNMGFARLLRTAPDLEYVQFVDGDCQLFPDWTKAAVAFLESKPNVAAVCGRLRERYPNQSVYNWLCDREWDRPPGEVRSCAGNVMMRLPALKNVGGYRDDVIAAEEDELCVRLRSAHWHIWRLPDEMALHDAAMRYFRQWWRRAFRAGYAFAQGAHLHGAPPERHFVRESRRAWMWGILLPLLGIIVGLGFHPYGWITFLIYLLQLLRLTIHGSGPLRDRVRLASFHLLARFPEGLGQIAFLRDRLLNLRPRLIEHK
jgi:GT2 family glycosyltransferase